MSNSTDRADLPQFLVETDWLAANLGADDLRIFDCTVHLVPDPDTVYRVVSGREDWQAGHIPGAGFLDLQGELSDRSSALRFTMPSPEQFADAMSSHGVGPGSRVVLYSAGTNIWATRIWWMLRAFGFDDAAVLNGGWTKWQAEGRPVSTEPADYPPAAFVARPRAGLIADKDQVLAGIGDDATCLINALSAEQHRGEGGRNYGRAGRIADSVNLPAGHLLDRETNAFLPPDQLRAKIAGIGADKADQVIAYCGGGIAASGVTFALAMLGYDNVSLYDNSLSEWVQDPSLPMETG